MITFDGGVYASCWRQPINGKWWIGIWIRHAPCYCFGWEFFLTMNYCAHIFKSQILILFVFSMFLNFKREIFPLQRKCTFKTKLLQYMGELHSKSSFLADSECALASVLEVLIKGRCPSFSGGTNNCIAASKCISMKNLLNKKC